MVIRLVCSQDRMPAGQAGLRGAQMITGMTAAAESCDAYELALVGRLFLGAVVPASGNISAICTTRPLCCWSG